MELSSFVLVLCGEVLCVRKLPNRQREKGSPSFRGPCVLLVRSSHHSYTTVGYRVTGGFGDQSMMGCVGGCSLSRQPRRQA
jgi:hypothetical protein